MLKHALTLVASLLCGVASADTTPQDERVCGQSPDGKVRWCITLEAPGTCGPSAGEHCDDNACWCGPEDANVWPGADSSGLPLVAREALQEHRVECVVAAHEGTLIGDCGYSGWVCREGWCQDTMGRGWWVVPQGRERV